MHDRVVLSQGAERRKILDGIKSHGVEVRIINARKGRSDCLLYQIDYANPPGIEVMGGMPRSETTLKIRSDATQASDNAKMISFDSFKKVEFGPNDALIVEKSDGTVAKGTWIVEGINGHRLTTLLAVTNLDGSGLRTIDTDQVYTIERIGLAPILWTP